MKMRFAVWAVILFIFYAGPAPAEVTIKKITVKGKKATVQFMYRNDSDNILSIVKIECGIRGAKSKREKGIVYFNNHFSGGIPPGYTREGSTDVKVLRGSANDIKCKDIPRPLVLK